MAEHLPDGWDPGLPAADNLIKEYVLGYADLMEAIAGALGALAFVRRHQQWITRAGGVMLVVVGVLLLTGWWDQGVQWVQGHLVNDYQVSV